jgi:TonB family protein
MGKYALMVSVILVLSAGAAHAQQETNGSEVAELAPADAELAVIREKVSDINDIMQSDYEVLLETEPEAGGTITVSFSITPDGTVTDAVVDCPDELAGMETSITEALCELEFEPTERSEDLPVTIPFELMPPE